MESSGINFVFVVLEEMFSDDCWLFVDLFRIGFY